MKTRFYILLAAVLCLAACEKNPESSDKQRDITYTVETPSSSWHMPDGNRRPMETVTVHLETEAEWQELLDRFCDWAEDGNEVTFYNANQIATKSATKDATTFSTTDREEMKRWMRQMEDEGLTVTVSYDPNTGTWNGTAYATAPQPVGGGHAYVCDRWPDYIAIMTVSPDSRVYGTWAADNGWSLYGLPWGICGYMFSGFTCLECPMEYHFTNIYWNGIDVSGTGQLHGDTLHMEYGGMAPQCNTCISVFDMVRSTQYETWVSTNNGYDVVMHIDRANRVAVAATPANYINTIVEFPQGRFHYEDDEYGNRQTYLGVYPPVHDTTPLYGNAYNILQVSPTQEEWRLICDCLNPPTFVFNRVD